MVERKEIAWLLRQYEVEVSWLPDNVNPYGEMDNILDGRSILEDNKTLLTDEEIARLEKADRVLRKHAKAVYDLLGREPKEFREKFNVPRSHWWWYMDELIST